MKAKRITALLTVLVLTAALSACGKRNIEPAQSGTESETESKVLKEIKEETTKEETTKEEITKEETTKEETTKEETTKEETTKEETTKEETTKEETTKEEITKEEIAQVETSATSSSPGSGSSGSGSSDSSRASDSGGSGSGGTSGSGSSDSGGTSGSGGSGSNVTTPTTVSTHTHNWKEHTATKQVWVPNIVIVDDYEERNKVVHYAECSCGFIFNTPEELIAHQDASMDAFINGTADSFCGGSMIKPKNVTETVKVGSHEEDHGHYETSTYVDYYYCDCGMKK